TVTLELFPGCRYVGRVSGAHNVAPRCWSWRWQLAPEGMATDKGQGGNVGNARLGQVEGASAFTHPLLIQVQRSLRVERAGVDRAVGSRVPGPVHPQLAGRHAAHDEGLREGLSVRAARQVEPAAGAQRGGALVVAGALARPAAAGPDIVVL